MARAHLCGLLVAGLLLVGCGGGNSASSTPTGPTSAPTPTPSTFTLTGLVVDEASLAVAGASVTVLDGANANSTTTTDAAGRYTFTGLSAGGFTVRVRRDGHDDALRGVSLTTSTTADFTLTAARINLTGSLTGTFSYVSTVTGQASTLFTTATVTQNGTAITGTFRIAFTANPADDWTGSFDGTLSSLTPTATYAGGLTISGLISSGSGRCNGNRSNVIGTVSQTRLALSAPGLWNWDECSSTRQDVVLTLNK